jgi:hypothetical protein
MMFILPLNFTDQPGQGRTTLRFTNVAKRVRSWRNSQHFVLRCICPLWGQSRHGLLRESAFAVAIGGKADIAFCGANVAF